MVSCLDASSVLPQHLVILKVSFVSLDIFWWWFPFLTSSLTVCLALSSPAQPDEAFLHGILFNFHIINFENPSFCICQCRRWSDNGFVRSFIQIPFKSKGGIGQFHFWKTQSCLFTISFNVALMYVRDRDILYGWCIHPSIYSLVCLTICPASDQKMKICIHDWTDGRIGLTDDCNWIWINIHLCVFARVSVCVFCCSCTFRWRVTNRLNSPKKTAVPWVASNWMSRASVRVCRYVIIRHG